MDTGLLLIKFVPTPHEGGVPCSLPTVTLPWFSNPLYNGTDDVVLNDALRSVAASCGTNLSEKDLHLYDISPTRELTLPTLSLSLALRGLLESSNSHGVLSNFNCERSVPRLNNYAR